MFFIWTTENGQNVTYLIQNWLKLQPLGAYRTSVWKYLLQHRDRYSQEAWHHNQPEKRHSSCKPEYKRRRGESVCSQRIDMHAENDHRHDRTVIRCIKWFLFQNRGIIKIRHNDIQFEPLDYSHCKLSMKLWTSETELRMNRLMTYSTFV